MDSKNTSTQPAKPYDYYRTFWTWHLYAGLFLSPILIVVAVTGAILVFPDEIERALRPDLWVVPTSSNKLGDHDLQQRVEQQYPQQKIFSYRQSRWPDDPYRYWLAGQQRGMLEVFVDPHNGAILGDRLREKSLIRITEQLHRRLMLGTWGSVVVDLTTGWTIVLLLTGLFMWWPKTLRRLWHGLTLRFRTNLKKFNWQLHNTLGFYSFALLLLLSLTGMVVSEVTGTMYRWAMLRTGAFPQALARPPESQKDAGAEPIDVDAAVAVARRQTQTSLPVEVRLPRDEKSSYLVTTVAKGESLDKFHAVIVDQYTGEVLKSLPWSKAHPLMKTRSVSLAIHFGSIYGLPTKILAFLACLATPVICLTGYLVWWWKRPAKAEARRRQLARGDAPRNKPLASMPMWLRISVVLFGLVFPSVGVTAAMAMTWGLLRNRS